MNPAFRFNCLFLVSLVAASPLWSVEQPVPADEVIEIARNYIGLDEEMRAVETLYYRGTLSLGDVEIGLEMFLRKPAYQVLRLQYPNFVEVLVLDGVEAFILREEFGTRRRVVELVPFDRVQIVVANTVENLYFFDLEDHRNASVVESVLTDLNGTPAYRLVTQHSGGVRITRFFDRFSGRLLQTLGADGSTSMESGLLWSNNMRFPARVDTVLVDGGSTYFIDFEEILVNSGFPVEFLGLNPQQWARHGGLPNLTETVE
jgi:hypothetical protein